MRCVKKTVYLSLGSNVGDRQANLEQAIAQFATIGTVTQRSAFYETEPMEVTDQPWFLNCAVELDTELMPKQFIGAVLDVERSMGRKRIKKKGPRTIDIDVVLFGKSIVEMKGLTVPHPAMHLRRFVLEPMVEIAPEVRHPVFKRSMRELRDALPAGAGQVKKVRAAQV
jgi:2-amino-4-hydroxy-6-hydroxymethyldihydropteridine diphosphokinase